MFTVLVLVLRKCLKKVLQRNSLIFAQGTLVFAISNVFSYGNPVTHMLTLQSSESQVVCLLIFKVNQDSQVNVFDNMKFICIRNVFV